MNFGGPSGRLPSVMSHSFAQVPKADIPRSVFDRSHGYKTTFDAGKLIPFFVDEALPGDTFNLKVTTFARMSTPIVPIMDNLYADTHFFAVPLRLIWDNFKKMMGEQKNPGDSTSYVVPTFTIGAGGLPMTSVASYMGVPTYRYDGGAGQFVPIEGLEFSRLFIRAYKKIWNEWFRDENLQNSLTEYTDDGLAPEAADAAMTVLSRGKRHDYFTSCLPWPQKGTAVAIPLGTTAPVTAGSNPTAVSNGSGATGDLMFNAADTHIAITNRVGAWANGNPVQFENLYADLTTATAATINSLRQAFQIQRLYERDARGGTRYTEIIRSHFGVVSPDARLQRSEFLGGGSTRIMNTPVPQTSSTDATTPQGHLAAFSTFSHGAHGFVKSFTEHCLIIGLISIRADLTYQQGLNRMFSRKTRFDFYWPALANLGEQAVLNKEIYAVGADNPAQDAAVFGYQERYAEYRYKPSVITGYMNSALNTGSLDVWHLGQKFTALPVLNSTFIQENPPLSRVLATSVAGSQFLLDSYFDLKCARPMPTYSVPGMIDHF